MDVLVSEYEDGALTNFAIDKLRNLSNKNQPFFLALGFKKPHLPFTAPKKYWDLYDRSNIHIHPMQTSAENVPPLALR